MHNSPEFKIKNALDKLYKERDKCFDEIVADIRVDNWKRNDINSGVYQDIQELDVIIEILEEKLPVVEDIKKD